MADASPASSPRRLDDVNVWPTAAGAELVDVRTGEILLALSHAQVDALVGQLIAATPGDDLADQVAAVVDDVLVLTPTDGMLCFRRALDEAPAETDEGAAADYYRLRADYIAAGGIAAGADDLARRGDYAAAIGWLRIAPVTAGHVPPVGPLRPCDRPVEHRIEAYRPGERNAHGSLDWAVYSCGDHVKAHIERTRIGVNVEPGRYGSAYLCGTTPIGRLACGDVDDYVSRFGSQFTQRQVTR
jgi:hypothetical protein